MNRLISVRVWPAALLLAWTCSCGFGQEAAAPKTPAARTPAAKPPSTKSPYRQLAPGVIDGRSDADLDETVSRHDVVGLLAVDPKFDWAKEIPFHRDMWVLKFQFKPMRMIWVDVPQPSGYMQRKPIWYMVYVVTNTGKVMHPVEDVKLAYETFEKRELYEVQEVDRPIRFVPEFLLEGHQHMKGDGVSPRRIPTA